MTFNQEYCTDCYSSPQNKTTCKVRTTHSAKWRMAKSIKQDFKAYAAHNRWGEKSWIVH